MNIIDKIIKKQENNFSEPAIRALRKMLCKQYLTTFDKVKITGISLIKSVNNNYWLLPQDRIRQC